MNYIKQLETDKKELENKNHQIQIVLSEMYVYLNSDKFKGILNDNVNVRDIIDRIMPVLEYTEDRPKIGI